MTDSTLPKKHQHHSTPKGPSMITLPHLMAHAVKGVSVSLGVGAVALLLNTSRTESVHTAQIEQLQGTEQKIDKLSDKLDKTDETLNRLLGHIEADDVARNRK